MKITKKDRDRFERLVPNGIPKYVRVYDNGGETIDRYTVVFSGNYTSRTGGWHTILGMSAEPYWPQGFGQRMSYRKIIDAPLGWAPSIGRSCHLGKRIPFEELPDDCKHATLADYISLWNLSTKLAKPILLTYRNSYLNQQYELIRGY